MWASMEADMLTNSTDDPNASNFQRKDFHQKSMENSRLYRKKQIKPKIPKIAISSDSNTLLDQPRQSNAIFQAMQFSAVLFLLLKI